MKRLREAIQLYRIYRQVNPPLRGLHAWRGCSPGTDMDCPSGKVIHTLKTAKAASKRARHRTELPLTPYRCNECGQWHVGTRSGLKRPVKTIYDNHQLNQPRN